jgi:hypothetical protein
MPKACPKCGDIRKIAGQTCLPAFSAMVRGVIVQTGNAFDRWTRFSGPVNNGRWLNGGAEGLQRRGTRMAAD